MLATMLRNPQHAPWKKKRKKQARYGPSELKLIINFTRHASMAHNLANLIEF
jgi:hypothetical protein